MKPVLSVCIVWSVLQDYGDYKPEETEPPQSFTNDVCSCRRTGERKDNVLSDKEGWRDT